MALLLGILLGITAPEFAIGLKFFSDAFLKLISMIVGPIVFCVVVHGIAGAGDLKKVGRVGVKATASWFPANGPWRTARSQGVVLIARQNAAAAALHAP